jgi:alkanesulfonate monooxygenase SsuD/methylene tetrahydromethanopterin reductase-like flavin-dependent oxidoreductase (luciferase family)
VLDLDQAPPGRNRDSAPAPASRDTRQPAPGCDPPRRFELGLGAGGFHDAIAVMGGPRRTVAEAWHGLSEAADIIRASWTGEPFRYTGQHDQVQDAQPGPRPAHDAGIWLGVAAPRGPPGRRQGRQVIGTGAVRTPPRLAELGGILTGSARRHRPRPRSSCWVWPALVSSAGSLPPTD